MGILTDIAVTTTFTETYKGDPFGNAFQLCQSDTRRYAIGFSNPQAAALIVTIHPDQTVIGGINVSPGTVLWLSVKDVGALAQAEWWSLASGVANQVTVYEILFPKE